MFFFGGGHTLYITWITIPTPRDGEIWEDQNKDGETMSFKGTGLKS
jgi:hypothetical protein